MNIGQFGTNNLSTGNYVRTLLPTVVQLDANAVTSVAVAQPQQPQQVQPQPQQPAQPVATQPAVQTQTVAPAVTEEVAESNCSTETTENNYSDYHHHHHHHHHNHFHRCCHHHHNMFHNPEYQARYIGAFSGYMGQVGGQISFSGSISMYGNMGMQGMNGMMPPAPPMEMGMYGMQGMNGMMPPPPMGMYGMEQFSDIPTCCCSRYPGIHNPSLLDNIMSRFSGYTYSPEQIGLDMSSNASISGFQFAPFSTSASPATYNYAMTGQLPEFTGSPSDKISQISSTIEELKNLRGEMGVNASQIESQIATLQEQLESLKAEEQQLEGAKQEKLQEKHNLTTEQHKQKNQQTKLNQEAKTLSARNEQVSASIEALKGTIEAEKAALESLEVSAAAALEPTAQAAIQTKIATLKAKIAMDQTMLQQQQAQLEQIKAQQTANQQQLQQVAQALQQLDTKLQAVNSEIDGIDKKLGKVRQEIAVVTEKVNQGLNFVVERRCDCGMVDSRMNSLGMYNNFANSMFGNFGMGQMTNDTLNNGISSLLSNLTSGNNAGMFNVGLSLLGGNPLTSIYQLGGFGGGNPNGLGSNFYSLGSPVSVGGIGSNFYSLGSPQSAGKIGSDFFSLGKDSFWGFKAMSSAFSGIGIANTFQSLASLF